MSAPVLRRGEIVLASLDPAVPPEQGKLRPVVVLANQGVTLSHRRLEVGLATVVPITSSADRIHDWEVRVSADETGLDRGGKVQPAQIRSISTARVVRTLGWVPAERMAEIDEALRLHLAL